MPTGLEINNSDGILMISSALIGYYCRKSGTGTVVAAPFPGNTSPAKMVVPIGGMGYTYPLVAISLPGYSCARAGNDFSTGNYIFTCDASVGTAFTYYVFDYSPTLPPAANGLEVYSPSGQIIFNTESHPLQALDVLSTGGSTYSGKAMAVGLPAVGGFRYAGPVEYFFDGVPVLEGDPYNETGFQNDANLYGGYLSADKETVSYSGVSFDDVYFGPFSGDIYVPPDFNDPCQILAVDVTTIPLNTTFF